MNTATQNSQATHTPGPWIVDDRHIHCATGLTYPRGQEPETDIILAVDTDCHERGLLNKTDIANLRLAAAAPDLLAALGELLDQATGPAAVYGNGIGNDGQKTGLSHWEFNALRDKRIAAARAAIARATSTAT